MPNLTVTKYVTWNNVLGYMVFAGKRKETEKVHHYR